jgi:hypothetical protein
MAQLWAPVSPTVQMPPDALKALQSQMAALQTQLQAMVATIRQLEALAATEPADPDCQWVEAYKTWIRQYFTKMPRAS